MQDKSYVSKFLESLLDNFFENEFLRKRAEILSSLAEGVSQKCCSFGLSTGNSHIKFPYLGISAQKSVRYWDAKVKIHFLQHLHLHLNELIFVKSIVTDVGEVLN